MTDINLVDLTNSSNEGVFDKLMSAMESRIAKEFSAGRITANEYGKVYLGVTETVMNQSIQFLLQKDISAKQAELLAQQKLNAQSEKLQIEGQTELIDAQRLLTLANETQANKQTELLEAQRQIALVQKLQEEKRTEVLEEQRLNTIAETAKSVKQTEVLEAQRLLTLAQEDSVQQDILLSQSNAAKVDRETVLLDQQELLMEAQTLLTTNQAAKVVTEQEAVVLEKAKITAETALVTASVTETNKKVEVLTAQLLNIPKEGTLIDKQVLKTESETTFLGQRLKTEQAQIVDSIGGVAVAGVIGKQKDLYAAQTGGFARDAEQKVLKTAMEAWVVDRSVGDSATANSTNKLNDANLGALMIKAMNSIGVTPI